MSVLRIAARPVQDHEAYFPALPLGFACGVQSYMVLTQRGQERILIVTSDIDGRQAQIAELFVQAFTASDGAEEGAMVGGLVRALLDEMAQGDVMVFVAEDEGRIVGAAIFSRLRYGTDPRHVMILSPMAVASDRQGQGIGQRLLTEALATLRAAGVDVAMTYGDPAFYGKVGFEPMAQDVVPAPLPLSQPEGWIGQSLTGDEIMPLHGPCTCVSALSDPSIW
ncbi:Predicted N-acetyltransferase YhbS [Roseovarius litoreus]|uniref:Predicted N-acetyltransferase YhbS n=1 Tax=Roseovarius litoreus TaxID=1155722 RepID=A0A1M7EI13_9RHOB|nr:Predicted N-acetyltransferase YhbS [Roseovarius litoreus]